MHHRIDSGTKPIHPIRLLIKILMHFFPEELRRQSGVPENLATSSLPHPELGLLGNRIREKGLTSFLMVLHEPNSYQRQRKGTLWGGSAPGVGVNSSSSSSFMNNVNMSSPIKSTATSFASKQNDLFTINEERI